MPISDQEAAAYAINFLTDFLFSDEDGPLEEMLAEDYKKENIPAIAQKVREMVRPTLQRARFLRDYAQQTKGLIDPIAIAKIVARLAEQYKEALNA